MFRWLSRTLACCATLGLAGVCWSTAANAQDVPSTGSLPPLPPDGPATPGSPPASTSPPQPGAAPASGNAPPIPAYVTPAPPPPSPGYNRPAYDEPPPPPEEPVPPPPQKPKSDFSVPAFSVRVDPLNWLLDGRLGLELEAQVVKFITVEFVPVFVTSATPPSLRIGDLDGKIEQHSNGLGALSGTSLGAGFWLSGTALRGTVLRAIFTNYGYRYTASDAAGQFDEVKHTERRFYGFIGSHSRFGAFTMAGGFGIGVELNKENRCFESVSPVRASAQCDKDQQLILVERPRSGAGAQVADLHSWTYPVELMFRFSLGVTID
ncbi:MAG TPA: hypothetical protein VFQ61_26510 [Polyangiaceae bacterium]|nr:hypothetical protein [Polyangiaceae bacterium]